MNAKQHAIPHAVVVVINKAGKAGKSTLSKQLVAPMLRAEWIQVETINDSGNGATAKLSGRQFGFVAEAVAASESSKCIDIGNSNYEAAKKQMQQIHGFAQDVHYWVVPCRASVGVINDSLSTVEDLINDLGVNPSRIVVIPNDIESPEHDLPRLASVARAARELGFHYCEVPVEQNPEFDAFNKEERSILEIADEEVDWNALISAEVNRDARAVLAARKVQQRRALGIALNLRRVWSAVPLAALTQVQAGEVLR